MHDIHFKQSMEKVMEVIHNVHDNIIQQRAIRHAEAASDPLGTDETKLENTTKLNADLKKLEDSAIDEYNKKNKNKH